MNLTKTGSFILGVVCAIGIVALHDAVAQEECNPAIPFCDGDCTIWGCDCIPAPTSLPNAGGCGDPFYYAVPGNCGTCIMSTPWGDVPCWENCGSEKAVEDYSMCYP